jgi:hypothetical protein
MKHFLTLLFLLISVLCYSQNKGDNTIIIKDTSVTMDKIRSELIKYGYVIDKDTPNYLTTEIKDVKGWYGMKYVASKDSVISLRAFVQVTSSLYGSSSSLILADYKGMNGSANKVAYEKLYLLAGILTKDFVSLKQ